MYTLHTSDQVEGWSKGSSDPAFGYNGTKKVGDYDDWEIREAVEFAAKQLGIKIPEESWFKEEEK